MKAEAILFYYGVFLIFCGITSVIFIGLKAKTALISGGISGLLAIVIGHLIYTQTSGAAIVGVLLSLSLCCVFAWRSTKTFFKVLELTASQHNDLRGKAIAFLIISLMAVTSLITSIWQLVLLS